MIAATRSSEIPETIFRINGSARFGGGFEACGPT
jgi:hypothetical protein